MRVIGSAQITALSVRRIFFLDSYSRNLNLPDKRQPPCSVKRRDDNVSKYAQDQFPSAKGTVVDVYL
jgi:hypothetical protein